MKSEITKWISYVTPLSKYLAMCEIIWVDHYLFWYVECCCVYMINMLTIDKGIYEGAKNLRNTIVCENTKVSSMLQMKLS